MNRIRRPIAYGVAAGVCLVMNNIIMIAADAVGMSLLEALATSFVIMVTVGYMLLTTWAFHGPRSWRGFARYIAAMAANAPANAAILWLFVKVAGQPMVVASPLTSATMVLLGYSLSRWALAGPGAIGKHAL